MNKAQEFIKTQKLMAIASADENGPWIANVYYSIADDGRIYFISRESARHSAMILKDPNIAFTVCWFDPANHKNRKAVQGLGACRLAGNEQEIMTGVALHNQNFPEFKERITVEWIHTNEWGSRVWVLTPTYMKYWDDELYGEDESKEFTLMNNIWS